MVDPIAAEPHDNVESGTVAAAVDQQSSGQGRKLKSYLTNVWVIGLLMFLVTTAAILLVIGLQQPNQDGRKPGVISLIGAAERISTPARNAGLACANPAEQENGKDATTALLLSIFLGVFGAHRWYYGQFNTSPSPVICCGGGSSRLMMSLFFSLLRLPILPLQNITRSPPSRF